MNRVDERDRELSISEAEAKLPYEVRKQRISEILASFERVKFELTKVENGSERK